MEEENGQLLLRIVDTKLHGLHSKSLIGCQHIGKRHQMCALEIFAYMVCNEWLLPTLQEIKPVFHGCALYGAL